jgi:farnesyl-diphosphate farnesyltransferase
MLRRAPVDVAPGVVPERALARAFCHDMLPRVSRTFALNIRLLPGALGETVLLAYLFCRIADTLEDSACLDARLKPALLEEYASLFPLRPGWEGRVVGWSRCFAGLESVGADHALGARAAAVFAAFAELPPRLRAPVESCVREMSEGMHRFALRKAQSPDGWLRLETVSELEEYCHYVAGTVGEMLCRLFAEVSPALDGGRLERMQRLAGRFGLALQLTNIVKDVADDARRGTCYVPRSLAARQGLQPEEILDPARRAAARAVVRDLAKFAAGALDAALAFTLLIPRREPRLRLFCLWPIFLAAGTLRSVVDDERLFLPGARARIERSEVRRCLGETTLAVLSDRAIAKLYARRRLALEAGWAST